MEVEYSIIIPTCNRADNLKECLKYLSVVETPVKGFEIIVVDNASSDNTKEVVLSFKDTLSNLNYFYEPRPGLMMGRHLGCEKAIGKILCYLDDDSFVDKGWLLGVEKAFSNQEVMFVGGPNLPKYEVDPPSWLDSFWIENEYGRVNGWLSLLDFGEQEKEVNPIYVFGCNFNIRKDIFIEIGGTHPDCIPKKLQRFQGDGESLISWEMLNRGRNALYSPAVKINHFIPASRLTLKYFCERAYYQGVCDSFTEIRRKHGCKGAGEAASQDTSVKSLAKKTYEQCRAIADFLYPAFVTVSLPDKTLSTLKYKKQQQKAIKQVRLFIKVR